MVFDEQIGHRRNGGPCRQLHLFDQASRPQTRQQRTELQQGRGRVDVGGVEGREQHRSAQSGRVVGHRTHVAHHHVRGDQGSAPSFLRRDQGQPRLDLVGQPQLQLGPSARSPHVGVGDECHPVLVVGELGEQGPHQVAARAQQRPPVPGGGDHHQPTVVHVQGLPVPVASPAGGEHPIKGGIAHHHTTASGRRKHSMETFELFTVRVQESRRDGFALVEEFARIQPGGPCQRTRGGAHPSVVSDPVRHEYQRGRHPVRIALGAGGQRQIMPGTKGLFPGQDLVDTGGAQQGFDPGLGGRTGGDGEGDPYSLIGQQRGDVQQPPGGGDTAHDGEDLAPGGEGRPFGRSTLHVSVLGALWIAGPVRPGSAGQLTGAPVRARDRPGVSTPGATETIGETRGDNRAAQGGPWRCSPITTKGRRP